jgi:hypothetical protein
MQIVEKSRAQHADRIGRVAWDIIESAGGRLFPARRREAIPILNYLVYIGLHAELTITPGETPRDVF